MERRTSLRCGRASWRVGSEFRNKTWAATIATDCLGVNGTYGKKWEVSLLWRLQHLQACRSGQMAKSNRLTARTPILGPQTASQPYKDPVSVPKVKASSRNTLPFSKPIGSESFISYLPSGQLGAQEEAWNCEVLWTHDETCFCPPLLVWPLGKLISHFDFNFIFWIKRTNTSLMGFEELSEIRGKSTRHPVCACTC